jgi:hypothetical protein
MVKTKNQARTGSKGKSTVKAGKTYKQLTKRVDKVRKLLKNARRVQKKSNPANIVGRKQNSYYNLSKMPSYSNNIEKLKSATEGLIEDVKESIISKYKKILDQNEVNIEINSEVISNEVNKEINSEVISNAKKKLLASDIWHDQHESDRGSFNPGDMEKLINEIVGENIEYSHDEDKSFIDALTIAVKNEKIKEKVKKYRIILTKTFTSQFQEPISKLLDNCNFVFDNAFLGEAYYPQGIITPAKYVDTAPRSNEEKQEHSTELFSKKENEKIIYKSEDYGFKNPFSFYIKPSKENPKETKLMIGYPPQQLLTIDYQEQQILSPREIGKARNGNISKKEITQYVINKALGDILVFSSCLEVEAYKKNNCVLVSSDRLIIANAIINGVSTLQASVRQIDLGSTMKLINLIKTFNPTLQSIMSMKPSVTFYTYVGKDLENNEYTIEKKKSIINLVNIGNSVFNYIMNLFLPERAIDNAMNVRQRGGAIDDYKRGGTIDDYKYWLARLIERGTDVIAERYAEIIHELKNVSLERFIKLKKDTTRTDLQFKTIFNSIAEDLEGYCYQAINHFLNMDLPDTIQGFDILIEKVKRFCPSVTSIYLKDGMFNPNIVILDIFKEDKFYLNGNEVEDTFYALQIYEIDFEIDMENDSQSYIQKYQLDSDKNEYENKYLKKVLDNFTNIQGTENRVDFHIKINYEEFDLKATEFIEATKYINLSKKLEVLTVLKLFVDFYLTEIASSISAYDFLHLYYILKHCGTNQYTLDHIVTEQLLSELEQYLEYSYSAFFNNIGKKDFLQNDTYCKRINSSERVKEQLLVGAFANYLNYQNHGYQINEDLLNETQEELVFKDSPAVNYYIDMMDQMVSLYLALLYAPFAINIQLSEKNKAIVLQPLLLRIDGTAQVARKSELSKAINFTNIK